MEGAKRNEVASSIDSGCFRGVVHELRRRTTQLVDPVDDAADTPSTCMRCETQVQSYQRTEGKHARGSSLSGEWHGVTVGPNHFHCRVSGHTEALGQRAVSSSIHLHDMVHTSQHTAGKEWHQALRAYLGKHEGRLLRRKRAGCFRVLGGKLLAVATPLRGTTR